MEDAPAFVAADRYKWETDELAAEVRGILAAIDAPPANDRVMFEFQKTLHRSRMFGEDGRGKIVMTCRCILESQGNEDAFSEPFVSAVLSAAGSTEFADRGLELIEAFGQIRLVDILETMRSLEFFRISEAESALRQIVRNKLRRILSSPQPEPVSAPSKKERIERTSRRTPLRARGSLNRTSPWDAGWQSYGTPCRVTGSSARPFASSVTTIHCTLRR